MSLFSSVCTPSCLHLSGPRHRAAALYFCVTVFLLSVCTPSCFHLSGPRHRAARLRPFFPCASVTLVCASAGHAVLPPGQNWPMAPLPAPLADTGLALPRQFADESPPPPSPTGSGRLSLFGTPPARDDGTALHSSQSWLRWRSGGRCLLPVRFRAGGVE